MQIDQYGDDIKHYQNISKRRDCIKKCQGMKECFSWTYVHGACWLKDTNTFTAFNTDGSTVAGIKDCKGNGKPIGFIKTN